MGTVIFQQATTHTHTHTHTPIVRTIQRKDNMKNNKTEKIANKIFTMKQEF